jgi:hypothetical protein
MENVLQVLVGLVVCAVLATALFYSKLTFFWEPQYPDRSSPIIARSEVMLVAL